MASEKLIKDQPTRGLAPPSIHLNPAKNVQHLCVYKVGIWHYDRSNIVITGWRVTDVTRASVAGWLSVMLKTLWITHQKAYLGHFCVNLITLICISKAQSKGCICCWEEHAATMFRQCQIRQQGCPIGITPQIAKSPLHLSLYWK